MATVRVALVVPSLAGGGGVPGVARFLHRVLEASSRYHPFLVSLAMSSRDDASVRLRDPASWLGGVQLREGAWEGRPYVHVGSRLAEFEFMRYAPRRPLTQLLQDADLVQVVAGAPCWVLPTLGSGMPVMLQVATLTERERRRRNQLEGGLSGLWRRAMTAVTKRLDRAGLRKADRIFVENRRMEVQTAAVAGPERVVFAPPGVDVDRFRPPEATEETPEATYMLSVARFGDPRKNPELLFRAFARLQTTTTSGPALWLAGPSGPPESAWRVARQHGVADRIRYLGRVSDGELARLYRNALLFVLSSDEEGFGLVLAEAMASGIPVVSTACGGPDDIVTHGKNGFLAPVGDAEALRRGMWRLVVDSNLRRKMGRQARRTAVEDFSLRVAGERFLCEYDSVMADDGVRMVEQ